MLQIILALAGLYILITGRIPGWLTGKPKITVPGGKARALGLVLLAPTPVAIGLGMIFGVLFGDQLNRYYGLIEFILVVVALSISLILIRKFRSSQGQPPPVQPQ